METYFSVSRYGAFLFRTDIISNSAAEAAKVQQVLRAVFKDSDGYEVTRSDRPSAWTVTELA